MKFKYVIADVETFSNYHSCTFKDINTGEYAEFVICKWRNDLEKYAWFINGIEMLVGYNNMAYDDHILHFVFSNHRDWVLSELNGAEIAEQIYRHSNMTINTDRARIHKKKYLYKPVDLFLLHHFDNPAKSTSLKQIEVRLKYHNVQDLPFEPSRKVKEEDIPIILSYCRNDVDITEELFKYSKRMLSLRRKIGEKYDVNVLSYNDVKLGEVITKKAYEQYSGLHPREFSRLRTFRNIIKVKNCIPPSVHFKTKYMNNILDMLRKLELSGTKGYFHANVTLGTKTYKLGQGGLHSEDYACVVERKPDQVLVEKDVASMYPSIILNEKIYPEHLGEAFLEGYKDIYYQRLKAKKDEKVAKDNGLHDEEAETLNAAFKLALNGTYGKLGSEYSWLYDIQALMRVTVAGQLYLLMLIEAFVENDIEVVSANTDGVVILYNKEEKQDTVDKIHQWWQKQTGLILENTHYDKIIFSNVNNYMAVFSNGYVKYKGEYEIDKALHKDNSSRIVPIAISEYFLNGTDPKETIMNHKDIYDFCISTKMRRGQIAKYMKPDKVEILGRVNRYYVSNNGYKLIKEYDDGRQQELVANQKLTLFNKYEDKDDYDIDYSYYIKEANKRIRQAETNQISIW